MWISQSGCSVTERHRVKVRERMTARDRRNTHVWSAQTGRVRSRAEERLGCCTDFRHSQGWSLPSCLERAVSNHTPPRHARRLRGRFRGPVVMADIGEWFRSLLCKSYFGSSASFLTTIWGLTLNTHTPSASKGHTFLGSEQSNCD